RPPAARFGIHLVARCPDESGGDPPVARACRKSACADCLYGLHGGHGWRRLRLRRVSHVVPRWSRACRSPCARRLTGEPWSKTIQPHSGPGGGWSRRRFWRASPPVCSFPSGSATPHAVHHGAASNERWSSFTDIWPTGRRCFLSRPTFVGGDADRFCRSTTSRAKGSNAARWHSGTTCVETCAVDASTLCATASVGWSRASTSNTLEE